MRSSPRGNESAVDHQPALGDGVDRFDEPLVVRWWADRHLDRRAETDSAKLLRSRRVDGAVGWRRFVYITIPLLKPVLLFVTVISVIGAFQIFGQTFIVTGGGPELYTRC